MRKLTILLVCCGASTAWADPNLLIYEGFQYAVDSNLVPPAVSNDPDNPDNQGLLHQDSGKYWYPAGTGDRPVIASGTLWFDNGMPAPGVGSNMVRLGQGNGTVGRIEIPNVPTDIAQRTVYWSGFFRVNDISGLAGAPQTGGSEGGVFVAGFNNTPGPQTGNISVVGAGLYIKRASLDADSPRFNSYYIGTATSTFDQCGPAANFACPDRQYADYDPALEGTFDMPSVYLPGSTNADTRPRFQAMPIPTGETVFLVGSYEFNTETNKDDVARIWINPDPNTFRMDQPPSANVVAPTNAGVDISRADQTFPIRTFFLRNHSISPAEYYFDELRVGLTWASVTGGALVPPGLPGDFNEDGFVDAADYVLWRKSPDDFEGPGGYELWRSNFGRAAENGGNGLSSAVPEPTSLALVLLATLAAAARRRKRD